MTEKELDEVISNSDEPELSPEQDEIKRLETELAKSQDEAQKNRDLYLRLLADVENIEDSAGKGRIYTVCYPAGYQEDFIGCG